MAEINSYLLFNGNCEAAFEFYRSVFGGEYAMLGRFSEMKCENPPPPEEANLIMHVSLPVGRGTVLMGSDCPPSQPPIDFGNNIMLSVSPDSKEDADRMFAALSAGGKVKLPMQDMFWGGYFGMLTDKFDINWQVNFAETPAG